jgi:hypothetical protein
MEAAGDLVVTQLVGAAPLVILAVIVAMAIPRTPGDAGRRIDWAGAGVFGIALVGIMYGLSEGSNSGWTSPLTIGPLAIGVAAFAAFLFIESRAETPLFDVKLLRRARLGLPLLLGVLVAMTMFGSQTPTVLYLSADPSTAGYGVGVSTGMLGIIFTIVSLATAAGSFLAPVVTRFVPPRIAVAAACVLMVAGQLLLTTGPTSAVLVTALFSATALGTGVILAVLPGLVVDRAPESAAASVSGLYNTGRTLGGSLAGAFVASVLTGLSLAAAQGTPDPAAVSTPFVAFQVIWIVFAVILLVSAVLALLLAPRPIAPIATAASLEIGATS